MPEKIDITLREVRDADLSAFFVQLQDPQAVSMATTYIEDPGDRSVFNNFWQKLLKNEDAHVRTIASANDPGNTVLGHIMAIPEESQTRVRYWIDRQYWGRGIATGALRSFLADVPVRPLFAYAPKRNVPAQRVLQNNGFITIGEDSGFDPARGRVVDDVVLRTND